MSFNKILLLGVSGLNVAIGYYVWQKNPRRAANRAFACFAAAVGLWSLGVFFAHNEPWTYTILFRLSFVGGSLMPLTLLVLVTVFPPGGKIRWQRDLVIFGTIGSLVTIFSFTPLISRSALLNHAGLQVTYGPLYPVFPVYVVACFICAASKLIWHYRHSSGLMKLQLRYLILGLVIPALIVLTTNLLIPLAFGTFQFGKFGPSLSVVMIAMIGHAIIRHQLLDIRVVIKKGVVYIAAFVVAGTVLAGLIVVSNALVPGDQWGTALDVLLGLLVAVLFAPLKGVIQRTFDRYLYRETYDYQRTFREASRRMVTMLDLRVLLPYVCDVINRTVRPDRVQIYILDQEGAQHRLAAGTGLAETEGSKQSSSLHSTAGLPELLRKSRAHLLLDELGRANSASEITPARQELSSLGGELALPILEEDQLTGFLVVGPKRSGDPYFAEDLDLLSTLTGQAAIAVRNARLYHQIMLVNEYVDNILKTMDSGVVAASVEGQVTLFNPAAERMTGLTATDARSGSVDRLPTALSTSIKATLADGRSRLQVETTISGVTGRATPVVCSTSPFHDVQGSRLGAVLVFSDLTRLKELEREKHRADRLATFGSMASGIAHEIKNPLVAIKTFAQLLPAKFTEQPFRENFTKVALREIDRIEGLLERLHDFSRPSEDALRVLDLREPIEATLELLRGQLEATGTSVRRIYPVAPLPVVGDPERLEQLFLNVFQNALEAMDTGGDLTIQLANVENEGASPRLRVQILDTGHGIPQHLLGRIFDPFVTTKPKGSGLGLAICRAIADTHHAAIRAENSPAGTGATVTVEFPAAVAVPEALRA